MGRELEPASPGRAEHATVTAADPPSSGARTATRVQALDVLRGLVMILMALDHTRDYVHAAAMSFQPEDLRQTTAAIFMTRWVTHFCAPVFMFTAGAGAFLRLERGGSKAELSRFLWTRGVWLAVLDFTAVRAGLFFDVSSAPFFLLVFWALGMSMIALAGLVWLPYPALLAVSVTMIASHNLLDGIAPAQFGALAWLWQILHVQGVLTPQPLTIVAYPLIPWIGVMAAGFCFGRVYRLPPASRRQLLLRLGLALTAGFLMLRGLNIYGDPGPWSVQSQPVLTLLSFLKTTKNPPSLSFLLMTLGPAMLCLAWLDRIRVGERNIFLVFGRVPLFYFLVHFPIIHAAAIAMTWLRYGSTPFLFLAPPTLGTSRDLFPADYGWHLWVTYALTAAVVAALYPVCLAYARRKARRREWWASYL